MLKGKFKKKNKEIELEEYVEEEDFEKEENELEKYSEEDTNLTNEEENNHDDFETYDEYLERTEKGKAPTEKIRKIINVVFFIIIAILAMITIDVINVSRYNSGPFFAIKLHTYNDGGTKEYYGFGYKVIKYNQLQGRRDTEIGLWNMPYNIEPTNISALDLAIEFRNKPEETYKKYYKKFLRITGTVKSVDEKNNKIVVSFKDPDSKYTLNINCSLATKYAAKKFKKGQDISTIGTVTKFTQMTKTSPNKLYMNDCFAE